MYIHIVLLACVALTLASPALAHGGGLDGNGCHTNRKTGAYHCHRGGAAADAGAAPDRQPDRTRPASSSQTSTRAYRNCDAARAAGAAPVHRGDAGYGPHLDRDGDGDGCEPRRQSQR